MPGLAFIPLKAAIVDQAGRINLFFRERWEQLIQLTGLVPAKAIYSTTGNAAIATGALFTVVVGGIYRVTFTARRTTADGVASTLQFTWHWTDGGAPLSQLGTNDVTDTTGHLYSETKIFPVDANSVLTFDLGYTSNTPGAMRYKLSVVAELISL
jgi:hypothetical protein